MCRQLAGVADEDIAHDYALTRIGREPAREMIMARLSKEPLFASNNEAALNMFTCRYKKNRLILENSWELTLFGCRHETMSAFLKHFEEKYGGAVKYLKYYVGFSDEEIAAIKGNILVPMSSHL